MGLASRDTGFFEKWEESSREPAGLGQLLARSSCDLCAELGSMGVWREQG